MVQLTEESILHTGKKYKGFQLKNVPASYLLYIYKEWQLNASLRQYIESRKGELEKQAKASSRLNRR